MWLLGDPTKGISPLCTLTSMGVKHLHNNQGNKIRNKMKHEARKQKNAWVEDVCDWDQVIPLLGNELPTRF